MNKPKINNKFHKNQLLMEDPQLAKFIPESKILTKKNLIDLLNKYKNVVIKPTRGSLGKGIIMVTEIGMEEYELLILNKKKHINGQNTLYIYLKNQENDFIPNIVQYYIPLAKVFGRPIDLRYIIQRKDRDWTITGKYAKVAKEGYAVTNFEHGSSILTVEEALKNSTIKNLNMNKLLVKLESITLSISKCLTRYFTNHMIWGCDLGIDEKGEIWIIEVNAAPQTKGFLELESLMPMYKTIESFKINKKKFR
ncbi:YheC/YheD family protein [Metabacillus rhizolycopersici]|uniref:YheC/YheD family protein n=1 Tax=Metabacillus rhizolycopersici TaxID=2875709 RepID=A0ABS7UUH3_9BACI|nr:YheC/YheD family protein [Metabacillus rhizolycopersici]MBZ5751965.1 YheC/YheD family protein [Metabacillus rhizolycopersici]